MNDTSEAGNWPYDLEVCFDFYTGGTNIKKKKKKNCWDSWELSQAILPVPGHQPLAGFYLTAKGECSVH